MTRKAHCCCGACSIEVEGEPVLNAICHCSNCKRRTGSAFGWSAYFADGADGPDGRLRPLRDRGPSRTGIAGGCFTDPPLPEPTVTVSNNGRCAWLGLPSEWRTSL